MLNNNLDPDTKVREAFGRLVTRYQDAAFAYAYAILRNHGLAEDATQAAFLTAWLRRSDLREPAAFAAWLRKIVRTECYRITRRVQVVTIPLDDTAHLLTEPASVEGGDWEIRAVLLKAMAGLQEPDRAVLALRYMSDFSYEEMARFMEIPVTTVKKRLHDARKRLRGQFEALISGRRLLQEYRPSRKGMEKRIMKVTNLLDDVCRGDVAAVRAALDEDPDLLFAEGKSERLWRGNANALAVAAMSGQVEVVRLLIERGAHLKTVAVTGISPLAIAAIEGRTQVVQLLLSANVTPDIFAAAALGDLNRVKALLQSNAFVDDRTFDGKTPLHFCRDVKVADVLLAAGADIDAHDDNDQTPLQWVAATGRFRELSRYLIERGAKAESSDIFWACAYGDVVAVRAFLDAAPSIVHARRPSGPGVPSPMVGNTPLHEAAVRGEMEIGGLLIQAHADVNARGGQNDVTPLHVAAACGHLAMVNLLLIAGADPKARDGGFQKTPEDWAKVFGHQDTADFLRQYQ